MRVLHEGAERRVLARCVCHGCQQVGLAHSKAAIQVDAFAARVVAGSLEPRASTEACHELLSDVERLPLAGKARVWLVCVKAHFSEVRRGYECANEVLGSHNGTSAHQLSHAHSLVLWRGN